MSNEQAPNFPINSNLNKTFSHVTNQAATVRRKGKATKCE
jgi:hypothetical protein